MRGSPRCLLPPLVVLAGLAAVAAVVGFGGDAYFRLRVAAGMKPYQPFLDLHAVMAAIECWHRGVDVYAANPCDTFGRLHIYSPLWLRLPAAFGDPWWLRPIGLGLGVAFGASLFWLPCAGRGWRSWAMLLAVASPVTAFALERANMDLAMYLLVLAGALLLDGGVARRGAGYALFLLAGLLKFYPVVLLGLLVRERPRLALSLGAGLAVVGALVALPLADEYRRAVANIHAQALFWGSFAAHNLPWGLMRVSGTGLAAAGALAIALALAACAAAWWVARRPGLEDALAGLEQRARGLLLVGAVLVVGCFLAGENIEYRAIFLLLTLPGLLRLAGPAQRVFGAACWVEAALMWDPVLRRVVAWWMPGDGEMPSAAGLAAWTVHELAWWWLVAVLLGVAVAMLRTAPLWGLLRPRPLPARLGRDDF